MSSRAARPPEGAGYCTRIIVELFVTSQNHPHAVLDWNAIVLACKNRLLESSVMMSFKGKLLWECQHRVSAKHFLNMNLNNLFSYIILMEEEFEPSTKVVEKVAEAPREQHGGF